MARRTTLAWALLIIVTSGGSERLAHAEPQSAEVLFEKLRASVVGIRATLPGGDRSVGSGVIVDRNEIVTNCHVVAEALSLLVEFSDETIAPAVLGAENRSLDICLITARTEARPVVRIAKIDEVKVGQPVYAIGRPLSLPLTMSSGIVSSVRRQEGSSLFQTTAPISPGSSGGGLFSTDGVLIGITSFTLSAGQNMNFAVPGEYIRTALTIAERDRSSQGAVRPKRFTFKGLPFGTSISALRQEFPGAACQQGVGPFQYCGAESVLYLGSVGSFNAVFVSGRMSMVRFTWPERDSGRRHEIVQKARARIIEEFGEPTQGEFPVPATWKVTQEQSISMGMCETISLQCMTGVGVVMEIKDDRYSFARNPEKDF